MKLQISDVLSSSAKFRIIHLLFQADMPMHLRNIELMSGLAVRSVQVALKSLLAQKILTKQKQGRRHLYKLNRTAGLYPLLKGTFKAMNKESIRLRAANHQSTAIAAFGMCCELHDLIRRGIHGNS
jgi:hypothetical protein